MEPATQFAEIPEANAAEEQQNPLAMAPFATASLSFSLPTALPTTHFFQQPKISALFSGQPAKAKVPTQASSLAHLSLSTAVPIPSKISFKSTISANPLQSPLSLGPHRPLDPNNGAGLRKCSIVLFRADLRVHDNECLNAANNESMSVLPVFCFDPRDYGKSPSSGKGPFQASFMLESVADLRNSLRSRGSDLVVRMGRLEEVLPEMAKAVGADAVYVNREVSKDAVKSEERIEAAMKEEGVEVKYFWGSTLFHVDDLPFKLEDMPSNYGGFREKVQGLEVRKTMAALDQLKGLPKRGDVELGEMPSLADLGVNPIAQEGKAASMLGGESEALQRIKKFAAECQQQPNKGTSSDNIYGANFSSKIAPWLTNGCISPRTMFDELKKTASNAISAAIKPNDGGDGGSNWLMNEFLWRDFFRFVTKKYSSPVGAPTPVGAGALA
ncbi:hypothetical protein CDL15_Pgr018650 [Punica granatum]|uniref:Photolyase/cryptochrome alpha/beta domain-containing protein n=1 Tax=Punica granatum TaxID=22663 RepID=A0A218X0U1_PUNGR|nr:hypothetical protein CDL15_Pgr018650 [Punica granatum]